MRLHPFNPLVETPIHPIPKVKVAQPSLFPKLALKMQGFRKRVKSRGDIYHFQCTLPPELWLLVFDIVLAPVRRTHELANSETFLSIMRIMLRSGTHLLEYDDWPRLRLVCRMFHDLLGPNRYQGIQRLSDDRNLPYGVEALSLLIQEELLSSFIAFQEPNTLSKIRQLDITLVGITEYGGTMQDVMNDLYTVAPNLPSFRSLTVRCRGKDRPRVLRDDTWQQIAHNFSMLEDLGLWNDEPIRECKSATFKKLRTLRIRDVPDTDIIRFPSLLHLRTVRWNPDGRFEMLHADQLVSLLAGNPEVEVDRKILHYCPNVRHLGGPISSILELEAPPQGHPINHLSIMRINGLKLHQKVPQLVQMLKRIPSVNTLSFRRGVGLSLPETKKNVIHALRKTNVTSIFTES